MKTIALALAALTLSLPASASRTTARVERGSVLSPAIGRNPDSRAHLTNLASSLHGVRGAEIPGVLADAVKDQPHLAEAAKAVLQAMKDEDAYNEVLPLVAPLVQPSLAQAAASVKADAGALTSVENLLANIGDGPQALAKFWDGLAKGGAAPADEAAIPGTLSQQGFLAPHMVSISAPRDTPPAPAAAKPQEKAQKVKLRDMVVGTYHLLRDLWTNKWTRYLFVLPLVAAAGFVGALAYKGKLEYLQVLTPGFWQQHPELLADPLVLAGAVVAMQIVQVAVSIIPAEAPMLLASLYMDFFTGLWSSLLGATIGGMITFHIGKKVVGAEATLGKLAEMEAETRKTIDETRWLSVRAYRKLAYIKLGFIKLLNMMTQGGTKAKVIVAFLYAFPLNPFKDFMGYLLGATKMGYGTFLLLNLARIPATIIGIRQLQIYEWILTNFGVDVNALLHALQTTAAPYAIAGGVLLGALFLYKHRHDLIGFVTAVAALPGKFKSYYTGARDARLARRTQAA